MDPKKAITERTEAAARDLYGARHPERLRPVGYMQIETKEAWKQLGRGAVSFLIGYYSRPSRVFLQPLPGRGLPSLLRRNTTRGGRSAEPNVDATSSLQSRCRMYRFLEGKARMRRLPSIRRNCRACAPNPSSRNRPQWRGNDRRRRPRSTHIRCLDGASEPVLGHAGCPRQSDPRIAGAYQVDLRFRSSSHLGCRHRRIPWTSGMTDWCHHATPALRPTS